MHALNLEDASVEKRFEIGNRFLRVLDVPQGRSGHPKDLRDAVGIDELLGMIVLPHHLCRGVLLPAMVAFVDDQKGAITQLVVAARGSGSQSSVCRSDLAVKKQTDPLLRVLSQICGTQTRTSAFASSSSNRSRFQKSTSAPRNALTRAVV